MVDLLCGTTAAELRNSVDLLCGPTGPPKLLKDESFGRFSKHRSIVDLQQTLEVCTLYEDSADFLKMTASKTIADLSKRLKDVAPVWKGGSDTSSDLVEAFLTWANCNSMSCNPNKCKELVIKKKGNSTFYPVVRNIPQDATLDLLLGLTFQNDCKFSAHIKAKLCKANKCLHVLRVCRKERYSQTEILF